MTRTPGKTHLDTLIGIQNLWAHVFGREFAHSWENGPHALRTIVEEGRKLLHEAAGRNQAHLTLLLREPLLDRLEIEVSTERSLSRGAMRPEPAHVPQVDENWDPERKSVYYPLCDRLLSRGAQSKNDETARKLRGLTGWVGVTGHYLKVNHEGAEQLLEHIGRERPETGGKIGVYGKPKWSRRTDEFPPDPSGSHIKRFLAVPIFASEGSDRPIGVLRYTCPLHEPELTETDKLALDGLAAIASAVMNISTVRAKAYREERLSLETTRLKETSNIRQFLTFLAEALGARIASAYVSLDLDAGRVLRLLDAVGISEEIGECRSSIIDYTWNGEGLTAELWRRTDEQPLSLESVRERKSWRGRNTEVFYGRIFTEWGISWNNSDQLGTMLKDYPIPLLGVSLQYKDEHVGVVKVEFPTTGQSLRQFDEGDSKFLRRAGHILAEEVSRFRDMVAGRWFGEDGGTNSEICIRHYLEIIRTGLVKETEARSFWDAVENFSKADGGEVSRTVRQVVGKLKDTERRRLMQAFKAFAKDVGKGATAGVGREMARLVFEVLRG